MEARILRWLSAAVVGVLSAALTAGLFLPVYSDELGWRFQERAAFDGVDKMFSEVCGANTLAVPPWFMWPVRWYSALFNGAFADPFWIRISGIVYALAWVAMALLLVRRLVEDRGDRAVLSTVGLGLLALGAMPLLMVWSRPEQPIVLAALGALLVAFADGPTQPPPSTSRQAWVRSLAILALSCVAISYHVKGLFLLPLMLGCLFFASRGAKAHIPRIIAGLAMLATIASAMPYWRDRLACPDNAVLRSAYNVHNLSGSVANISSFADANAVFFRMIGNISVFQYLTNVAPRVEPMSFWLPSHQIDPGPSFQWFVALCAAWGLALVLAGLALAFNAYRGLRDRRLDSRLVLAALTFGIVLAWSATQAARNAYESSFVMPLIALAIMLALSMRKPDRMRPWLNISAGLIGVFALVSPFAIGSIYGPALASAAQQRGYIKGQPFSVSVFGFSQARPEIEAVAKLCGIPDPAKARAVMVDDFTYSAFIHSKLPQHQLGVIGGWNGLIEDPIGYLKRRRSDGAVLSCRFLDDSMRRRAKRIGDICCLGPPDW